MNAGSGRHLSTQALLEHWNSGVPVLIPLAGDPLLGLRIDAPGGRLTLRTPISADTKSPANPLSHVDVVVLEDEGQRFLEITTTDERLIIDGYAMLSTIADRIQIDGIAPVEALEDTLARWHSILSMRTRMSHQAEVGLFGELLVLEALLSWRGDAAVKSWRGTVGEEHDFGFDDADIEVKTTTVERRHHWIHGLGQLLATPPTPLWLLSIQITRGGLESGRTLGRLVEDVLAATSDEGATAGVHEMLEACAWRDEDHDLFSKSWRLRTKPLALRVDNTFPRLTSECLSSSGVNVAAIRQVTYEIDVTDRPQSDALAPSVAALLERMEDLLDV